MQLEKKARLKRENEDMLYVALDQRKVSRKSKKHASEKQRAERGTR